MNKLISLVVLILLVSCKQNTSEKLMVTVSVLPQKYFVERIAGNLVDVNVMIDPGMNPTNCDLSVSKMYALSNSKICFIMGALPYEQAQLLPILHEIDSIKVVSHSDRLNLLDANCGCVEHEHSDVQDGHAHIGGKDPHIWVSLKNGKVIAEDVLLALSGLMPDKDELFRDNYKALIEDIDKLEEKAEQVLKNTPRKTFMIYHPALTYFADDYGLEQIAIEDDGKSPSPKYLSELIELAKQRNVIKIFVQTQFDMINAKNIADELGISIVTIDPLSPNWLAEMDSLINLSSN